MGKEEELKNKELVILDYKDAEFIPESLRAYVEYLGEEEIMGTATDDNRFMPNGVITRAQVATLMSRVVNKMSIEDGNTTPEDTSDDPIDENTNNTDTPTETDVKTPAEEETQDNIIRGPIKKVAVDLAGSKRSITIIETVNGTQKDVIIPVIENVEVTIDGKKSRVTLIKALDYAEVEVNDKGEAIRIEAEKKDKTVNGVISEVNTEKGTVTVNSNSETESFKAAIDMKVVKNGTESDITKIRKGDTVTLTLEYNLIKSINSKSIQKQVEGQISEIIISDNPKITLVDLSGKKGTYDISKNVAINVFDKKEDIYGLRLGYKAKLSLDSSEVIDISTYEQITGVIESIEESFNEISLTPDDRTLGQSIQLLTNESTKYINNKTKTEMLMRDIKVGQKVAITGRFGKASFYVKEIYVME